MGCGVDTVSGWKCMDIQCSCSQLYKKAKNVTFSDGINSKEGTKCETMKKQQMQNQQHIVDNKIPKWDNKHGQKKTKH